MLEVMVDLSNLAASTEAKAVIFISEGFGAALKELLETRHLYQKTTIKDIDAFWKDLKDAFPIKPYQENILKLCAQLENSRFYPSTNLMETVERTGGSEVHPTLILKNVKMFCSRCQGREAFSPIWSQDLANELSKPIVSRYGSRPDSQISNRVQFLYLAYQCQHCKQEIISIIVKRDGWQLALHGRSPMENIEVPSFIPKPEQWLFRDTLVAMHGGKILAALFYLRTFIEQFARRLTGTAGKETGDVIMESTMPLCRLVREISCHH
jgi:hypothetical protein